MNGNTRAKVADFSQTISSTVQISFLGNSDTPFKVGYLQIFSVIRGLSPTRKSVKRVCYEIVWTRVVYLLPLHCTHRALHAGNFKFEFFQSREKNIFHVLAGARQIHQFFMKHPAESLLINDIIDRYASSHRRHLFRNHLFQKAMGGD